MRSGRWSSSSRRGCISRPSWGSSPTRAWSPRCAPRWPTTASTPTRRATTRRLADLRAACAELLSRELGRAVSVETLMASIRFRAYRRRCAGARRACASAGSSCVCVSNWDIALPEVLERCGLAGPLDGRRHLGGGRSAQARPGDLRRGARARRLRAGRGAARRRHARRGRRRRRARRASPRAPGPRWRRPRRGRDCVAGRDRPASADLTDEPTSPGPPPSAGEPAAAAHRAADRDPRRRPSAPRAVGPGARPRRARVLLGRAHRRGGDRRGASTATSRRSARASCSRACWR